MKPKVGKRYRQPIDGNMFYITIFPENKEIFISGEHLTPEIDLITRLISKLWQNVSLAECIDQLQRSSVYTMDFCGVISKLLENCLD